MYKYIPYERASYLTFSAFAFHADFSSYFVCLRENLNIHCNRFLITSMKNSCLRLQIYVLFTKFAIYWELRVLQLCSLKLFGYSGRRVRENMKESWLVILFYIHLIQYHSYIAFIYSPTGSTYRSILPVLIWNHTLFTTSATQDIILLFFL